VHVPQHAYGGAYYALKAVAMSDPNNAEAKIAEELNWITRRLSENLREEILSRIMVQKRGDQFFIKIQKGTNF
jgi:hypothetical protein